MSLDTKWRPRTYADVLGQRETIQILKQYVSTGAGFHQSYLFAGPFGSGKTTLARVLARALLCAAAVEGEPCDRCTSCKSLLDGGSSPDFSEIDAATNSGKDSVRRIVDEIQYSTFSGKRRLYLFDECFTEDALLVTPEGLKSIRDLVRSKYDGVVLSHDIATGESVWAPLEGWFDQGVRDVTTLTFDNGVSVTVTRNHLFYTTNRGWVEAGDITEEDDVVDNLSMPPPTNR